MTRAEAKAAGAKRYNDGTPCLRGHVGDRRTASTNCCACERLANAKWRTENKEKMRECVASWMGRNKDRVRSVQSAYAKASAECIRRRKKAKYEANKEYVAARNARWRRRNIDLVRQIARDWQQVNRGAVNAATGRRYAAKSNATPSWADRDTIKAVYAECSRISEATGIPHHVDHILPLRGKTVCGLHIASNLQIIPAVENFRKNNRLLAA